MTIFRELVGDLRYGFRISARSPGFTTAAVLTLALGVGATTAIFTVINGVLLKPLPYANADRLVAVFETEAPSTTDQSPTSPANFLDWREQSRTLEAVTAATIWMPTLTGEAYPDRLAGLLATGSLFEMLEERPLLGRTLRPDDLTRGDGRVVLLSHGLRQRHFGGDPEVVDQVLTLDDEAFTVIGVMPEGFRFPPFWAADVEIYAPLVFRETAALARASNRDAQFLRVFARLAPDVTLNEARAELQAIGVRLAREYPDVNRGIGINVQAIHEPVVGDIRPALLVLLATVGLVLLIACANVANLMLARGTARRQEFAVRAALGAGGGRLVRQLLAESLVISALGGVGGLVLGSWGVRLLLLLAPAQLPRLDEIAVDGRVVAVALALTVLSALGFGLGPALMASRADGVGQLQGGRVIGGRERHRMQQGLVVAQIGLALMLLVGAGLLANSFVRMQRVDPGFATRDLITTSMRLTGDLVDAPDRQQAFFDRIVNRLEALPGVARAGFIHILHIGGDTWTNGVAFVDRPPEDGHEASVRAVTPGLFDTMQIPIVRGRPFEARDTTDGQPVTIVNQTFAERFFPDGDAVGQQVKRGRSEDDSPWRTVVGIVGDVHQDAVVSPVRPEMYFPYAQNPFAWARGTTLVVRGDTGQAGFVDAIRREVWAVDESLPLTRIRTSAQLVDSVVAADRFTTWLLAIFAATAVALAAIGIHGVIAYTVSRRTREIGIRVALGATRGDVLSLVVRQGLGLAALGVVLGLLGAYAGARTLDTLLFGVTATDPATFLIVTALLAAIATMACVVAARPAVNVEPATALRQD